MGAGCSADGAGAAAAHNERQTFLKEGLPVLQKDDPILPQLRRCIVLSKLAYLDDPAEIKITLPTVYLPGLVLHRHWKDPYNFALFRDDQRKKWHVAFRGTKEPRDAFMDAKFELADLPTSRATGRVHHGFYNAYMSLIEGLRHELDTRPDYEIEATGHSAGGAIAIIFHVCSGYTAITTVTFGAPMVFAKPEASDQFTLPAAEKVFNLVNGDDIVPRILAVGFHDQAKEAWTVLGFPVGPPPGLTKLLSSYVPFGNYYWLHGDDEEVQLLSCPRADHVHKLLKCDPANSKLYITHHGKDLYHGRLFIACPPV